MTLPSSGALSLNSIQGEFGGSNPIGLNEYYRGGSLVPNHSNTSSIPTSGLIDVQDFYGTSVTSPLDLSYTITVGTATITQGKFAYTYSGYANSSTPGVLGNVGGISDNSVASGGTSGTVIGSWTQHYSGWPNNITVVGISAHVITFNNTTTRDAILTGRSGANFAGLGNENWASVNGLGNAINQVGDGNQNIFFGVGFGGGTNSTELARITRFAQWLNGSVGSSRTITFF